MPRYHVILRITGNIELDVVARSEGAAEAKAADIAQGKSGEISIEDCEAVEIEEE